MNPFKRYALPLAWIVPPIAGVMAVPFMLGGEAYRLEWGYTTAAIAAHWVLICYLLWLLLERSRVGYKSPKAIRLDVDAQLLLITGSEWLGQGVGVTVFECSAGYEKQLALGEVFNVQEDSLVLLRLFPFADDPEAKELRKRLAQLGRTGLQGIIVKPGPLRYLP